MHNVWFVFSELQWSDHFAHVAQDYDRLRTGAGAWQEIAEVALERLGQPRRLIDVGCGTGRFASLAAERLGARVWGVDTNEAMLQQAKAHAGGKLAFRRAAAERLPFKEGWFDAGHMHLVLHLLADPAAALTELARVLGAGARLVIVTFDADHFRRFYLNPYFPSIEAIDAQRFALPQTTEAQLEAAGFEVGDARADRAPLHRARRRRARAGPRPVHLDPFAHSRG